MVFLQRILQFIWRFFAGTRQQRRQARYQLWMQWRGIDLRWTSVEDLGLDRNRAEAHGNSGGPGLEVVLKTLPIRASDSILDIGCGKGGAMITLYKWPFQRIDGIEICAPMIAIARQNLTRLHCMRGTILQRDAATFQDLDAYNYFYLYNPFPEVVMRQVLENIRASLARAPRRATLIYMNPVCHDLLVSEGFQPVRLFEHTIPPFRVYAAGPAPVRVPAGDANQGAARPAIFETKARRSAPAP